MGSIDGHNVREEMTQYWVEHSSHATEKEMMLDNNAEELGKLEIPEILGLLPDVTGKDVLELGAGIGRFTKILAPKANSVIALDFMQKFVDKNEEDNAHMGNIQFLCMDVCKLELPENSLDIVFSNWLFMYLEEAEILKVFRNVLSWLRDGGTFFFRESCFHKSGSRLASFNPTRYRAPAAYADLIDAAKEARQEPAAFFEIALSRSVQTYIKMKDNQNQICWLFHKERRDEADPITQPAHAPVSRYHTQQLLLDRHHYPEAGILRAEKACGKHFINSGGIKRTQNLTSLLNLKYGETVLDVGCGIGGSAFYMANTYDVQVLGMDLSYNMISIALQRATDIHDRRVQFEVADVTRREYEDETFNAIYCRDTQLHITNKRRVMENFYRWLKPGGKLLLTDYCCADGDHSEDFATFIQHHGFDLLWIGQYVQLLANVGFTKVTSEDRTKEYRKSLVDELDRLDSTREEQIKEIGEEEYDLVLQEWRAKLKRVDDGEQKWGVFYTEKPKN